MNDIYSFYQLITKYKIEIPVIQRDYAQGRDNQRANSIRKSIVQKIIEAILNGENLFFDFVYGRTEESIFIPFDGQQRLTTLFLFHKYVFEQCSTSSECKNNKNCICSDLLARFSYYTRTSSKEFCKLLASNKVIPSAAEEKELFDEYEKKLNSSKISKTLKHEKLKNFQQHILSQYICNKEWFYIDWDKDPTIAGMLFVLDEIHEQLKQHENISYKDFAEKLTSGCNCPITFHYVDMGAHKLSDETYIKMNARGKTLTAFENFKASLEQYLNEKMLTSNNENEKTEYKQLLERLKGKYNAEKKIYTGIDGSWLEYFYKENGNILPDEMIHSLFNRHFLNVWSVFYKQNNENKNLDEINGIIKAGLSPNPNNKSFISWDDVYKPILEKCGAKKCLSAIFNMCDYLTSANQIHLNILPDWKEIDDEDKGTNSLFKRKFTHKFRIIHLGVVLFFENLNNFELFEEKKYKDWLRVIWNIASEPNLRTEKTVEMALVVIAQLAEWSQDILQELSSPNNKEKLEKLLREDSSLNKQLNEEIYKASLIINNICSQDDIIKAERLKFLEGRISFLFTDNFKKTPSAEIFIHNRNLFEEIINSTDEYHWLYIFISYITDSNWLQKGNDITLINHEHNSWRTLINESFQNIINTINADEINPNISSCPAYIQKLTELLPVYAKNRYGLLSKTANDEIILFCTAGKRSWLDNFNLGDEFHYNKFLASILDSNHDLTTDRRADKTNLFWGNEIVLKYRKCNYSINSNYEVTLLKNDNENITGQLNTNMTVENVIQEFDRMYNELQTHG